MDLQAQIDEIVQQEHGKKKQVSQLGFFSKPVLIKDSNRKSYVVKLYRPLKNEKKCQDIIIQHNGYLNELKNAGIQIPETVIQLKKIKNKFRLIIIQDAFEENELVRNQLEAANETGFLEIMELILDDVIKFLRNKPVGIDIGFHPTLRNYAIRNNQLFYFDTFPPMLMSQRELNKLIITMAPAKLNIRFLIPTKFINRVSNEYYQQDKMITGIIGSCCRLRPNLVNSILAFSRKYITSKDSEDLHDREKILKSIESPPRLPRIWLAFRKIFGKTGKPNV